MCNPHVVLQTHAYMTRRQWTQLGGQRSWVCWSSGVTGGKPLLAAPAQQQLVLDGRRGFWRIWCVQAQGFACSGASLRVSSEPVFRQRANHIDSCYRFLREKVRDKAALHREHDRRCAEKTSRDRQGRESPPQHDGHHPPSSSATSWTSSSSRAHNHHTVHHRGRSVAVTSPNFPQPRRRTDK